jgi:hypothetical protein
MERLGLPISVIVDIIIANHSGKTSNLWGIAEASRGVRETRSSKNNLYQVLVVKHLTYK